MIFILHYIKFKYKLLLLLLLFFHPQLKAGGVVKSWKWKPTMQQIK